MNEHTRFKDILGNECFEYFRVIPWDYTKTRIYTDFYPASEFQQQNPGSTLEQILGIIRPTGEYVLKMISPIGLNTIN